MLRHVLKTASEAKGLTQEELAKKARIAREYLTMLGSPARAETPRWRSCSASPRPSECRSVSYWRRVWPGNRRGGTVKARGEVRKKI